MNVALMIHLPDAVAYLDSGDGERMTDAEVGAGYLPLEARG